ncbi:TcpQ domain-containing protein [Pelomicrobium methylotrophicum]|uniref:TcpQ domain-containing protein n=1 Tax=Pelomicrobium methylotrophicum TaxID=2602750 RepID=UPI001969AF2D|nr:TcpQ domain-containing protein [Pelomicrobium methylotrophicum]
MAVPAFAIAAGLKEVDTLEQAAIAKNPHQASGPLKGAKVARVAPYRFEAARGERLSEALRTMLESEGWTLVWDSGADYLIRHDYSVEEKDLESVLKRVLSAYGLSATIYTGNSVVAVYPSETGK